MSQEFSREIPQRVSPAEQSVQEKSIAEVIREALFTGLLGSRMSTPALMEIQEKAGITLPSVIVGFVAACLLFKSGVSLTELAHKNLPIENIDPEEIKREGVWEWLYKVQRDNSSPIEDSKKTKHNRVSALLHKLQMKTHVSHNE